MTKIILSQRPKNFKCSVSFPMLSGAVGIIECTFKYRSRREFGELLQTVYKDAAAVAQPAAAPVTPGVPAAPQELDLRVLYDKGVDKAAAHLQEVLEAWGLDEPLTLENLDTLADGLPAAAGAIMEAYRIACTEGRLGN